MTEPPPIDRDPVSDASLNFTLPDLQAALSRDEFIDCYQPKVYLVSGAIVGAEALLRWRQSDGTIVPPGAFIPLAESTGSITEITIRMLQTLSKDLASMCAIQPDLVVAFNVSARDFQSKKFFSTLFELIDSGAIKSSNIEIEITESSVLGTSAELYHYLADLHDRGIKLAMDDFGTGYANFLALSQFPFSSIKLDIGVIQRMSATYKGEMIARSSIQMAHYLGLDVVAEGIELEYTYAAVQRLGCQYAQGFWIGHGMPIEEFLRLIRFAPHWPTGLVGMVYLAMIDHIEWRKRVIDAILMMDQQRAPMSEADINRLALKPSESRLGRWYQKGIDELEGLAVYRELGQAHHDVHACATVCVNEALAGTPLVQLMDRLKELSNVSTILVGKLLELEISLMKEDADARAKNVEGAHQDVEEGHQDQS